MKHARHFNLTWLLGACLAVSMAVCLWLGYTLSTLVESIVRMNNAQNEVSLINQGAAVDELYEYGSDDLKIRKLNEFIAALEKARASKTMPVRDDQTTYPLLLSNARLADLLSGRFASQEQLYIERAIACAKELNIHVITNRETVYEFLGSVATRRGHRGASGALENGVYTQGIIDPPKSLHGDHDEATSP